MKHVSEYTKRILEQIASKNTKASRLKEIDRFDERLKSEQEIMNKIGVKAYREQAIKKMKSLNFSGA